MSSLKTYNANVTSTTREARFYINYLKHTTSIYEPHHRKRRKKGKPIL